MNPRDLTTQEMLDFAAISNSEAPGAPLLVRLGVVRKLEEMRDEMKRRIAAKERR